MRLNENTVLLGPTLRLVPYRPEHCERYHAWMQDPELLELTCSEPLSLEEEQANQRSWHEDPSKLTYIVCAGASWEAADLTRGMCGDVNAFFSDGDDDDGGDRTAGPRSDALQAELEVMIAEASMRRRGLARLALLLLVRYIAHRIPRVTTFVAKITDANAPSLRLFRSLGFEFHKHIAVFETTEMRMSAEAARAVAEAEWERVGASEAACEPERLDSSALHGVEG